MKNKILIIGVFILFSCQYHKKPKESLKKVDLFVDGRLETSYFINEKDILIKSIGYNLNKIESQTMYYYNIDGQFDSLSYSSESDLKEEEEIQYKNFYSNLINIAPLSLNIRHPFLLADPISNISYIFNSMNFEIETKIEHISENESLINLQGINKRYRFYPSYITLFIPEPQLVNSYKLWVKNKAISKEEIVFENGVFEREYCYNSHNEIVKIKLHVKYADGNIRYSTMKFMYYE